MNAKARRYLSEMKILDKAIERKEIEIRRVRDLRQSFFESFVAARFGVRRDTRVFTMKTTRLGRPPVRREYAIVSVGSDLGSKGTPWLTGRLVRKDGTVSDVRHPLYEDWQRAGLNPHA